MKWNGLQLPTSSAIDHMSTMAHTEVEFCHYYKEKGKSLYKETQINTQSLCTWLDRELYVPAGSVQDTLQLSDILQIFQVLLFTMSVLMMLLSADNTEPLDLPGCLGAAGYWDNRAIQSCYDRVLIVLFFLMSWHFMICRFYTLINNTVSVKFLVHLDICWWSVCLIGLLWTQALGVTVAAEGVLSFRTRTEGSGWIQRRRCKEKTVRAAAKSLAGGDEGLCGRSWPLPQQLQCMVPSYLGIAKHG